MKIAHEGKLEQIYDKKTTHSEGGAEWAGAFIAWMQEGGNRIRRGDHRIALPALDLRKVSLNSGKMLQKQ